MIHRIVLTKEIYPIEGLSPGDIIQVVNWVLLVNERTKATQEDVDFVLPYSRGLPVDFTKLNKFINLLEEIIIHEYVSMVIELEFEETHWVLRETICLDPLAREYLAIVNEDLWWINF
jgi:hypothetical protein